MFLFGTKAETLEHLFHHQEELGALVLPLCYYTTAEWQRDAAAVWQAVDQQLPEGELIVRSSAKAEDTDAGSMAGKFESKRCARNKDAFLPR